LHADVAIIGIEHFAPSSHAELLGMLHVRTGAPTSLPLEKLLEADPDLVDFVKILATSGLFAGTPPPEGSSTGAEINYLKQFREIHDMGCAIYRAIVAARTLHRDIGNLGFFDIAEVEIDLMYSDSIKDVVAFFGLQKPAHPTGPPPGHAALPAPLPPGEIRWDLYRIPVNPKLAFYFTSNVRFEVLDTIYTYQPS
jgi:hypothetical protein